MDSSVVRCVRLANNGRVEGKTQAEVLVNFGREDQFDLEALRWLVVPINRYLGVEDTGSVAVASVGSEAGPLEWSPRARSAWCGCWTGC